MLELLGAVEEIITALGAHVYTYKTEGDKKQNVYDYKIRVDCRELVSFILIHIIDLVD